MDLAQHFRVIWSRRLLVVGAALLAALAVFAWRVRHEPVFEAETRIVVTAAARLDGARPTGDDADYLARSFAERAQSRPVLAAAGEASGLGLDADEVASRVDVSTVADVGTIVVTASGSSAPAAAALSDAIAATLVDDVETGQQARRADDLAPLRAEIEALSAQLATLPADDPARAAVQTRHDTLVSSALQRELRPVDRLAVVAPADPASDPVGPRPVRDAALAFLIAFVLTAETAVIASALSGRFVGRDLRAEISAATGLPVLATVGRAPAARRRDAINELRANLALMTPTFDAPSSVAVVGTEPGAGCTQIALDLAVSAARGSRPVLLVDGDIRTPSIHERVAVADRPGLSDVLLGAELSPIGVTTRPDDTTMYVLPAGGPLDDPLIALSEHLADRVLTPAAEQAGLTIVDTPALVTQADGAVIAAQCDTTVLVMDAGTTSRQVLADVLARLRQVGVIPLGIVLNRAPGRRAVARGPATDARPVVLPRPAPAAASSATRPLLVPDEAANP